MEKCAKAIEKNCNLSGNMFIRSPHCRLSSLPVYIDVRHHNLMYMPIGTSTLYIYNIITPIILSIVPPYLMALKLLIVFYYTLCVCASFLEGVVGKRS